MITTKFKLQKQPPSEAGFTIMESLVAIVIVTALMIAIAPAIALSVATRVQAKRVELASQAARSYIDGVRSGVIDPPPISNTATNSVSVPTAGSLTCSTTDTDYPYCSDPAPTATSSLYCIDLDETAGCSASSYQDFIIQAFGFYDNSTVPTGGFDPDEGYQLGLRVYRADGFETSTALKTQQSAGGKQLAVGVGDNKAPLVEITTEILPSGASYNDLCTRINGVGCP